jgi:hypothetical protein
MLDGVLPLEQVVLGLGQLLNVVVGIVQSDELSAVGRSSGSSKRVDQVNAASRLYRPQF